MARTLGSHAKHTKPKISAIALNLFSEQGFAAVSMRQIAAKAGLQAGALYNYFPDKQTILSELLINHMENLLETWSAQVLPEKLRGKYELILSKILTDGVKEDLFSCKDIKITSLAIIGMLKELNTWYKKDGRVSVLEVKNIYKEIVLKAVS